MDVRRIKGIALVLAAYSSLCTAAPILLLKLSGLYLQAHEISILALAELPLSILLGMVMVKEFPSLASWAGAALILAAGVIGARSQG